jgi:hypothetical protein
MNKLYPLVLGFTLPSCATSIDYIGNTYAPSRNVDVYVDPAAIKREYTVMGKGYPSYPPTARQPFANVQKKSIQKAMERGADAILMTDQWIDVTMPGSATAETRKDSTGFSSRVISTGPSTTTVPRLTVYFLKYQ